MIEDLLDHCLNWLCRWRRRHAVPALTNFEELDNLDVFAARSLRPLSPLECDSLSFAELVERGLTAGGAVKEVLVSVGRQDEPESFVAHQPLDRAIQSRHRILPEIGAPCNQRGRALLVSLQSVTAGGL